MMKSRFFLLPVLVCALSVAAPKAQAADDSKDEVMTRLDAMQKQLDRIEDLLQRTRFPESQLKAEPGQVQVSILGQVNVPGVYNVEPGTPIGVVVALAHGWTRIANPAKISVVSKKGETFKVDAKKDAQTYKVNGGDIITVGEAFFN